MINKILDKVGSGGVWLAALSYSGVFPCSRFISISIGIRLSLLSL